MTNDNKNELRDLSHELVQLRYSMDHGKLDKAFTEISFVDYVLLTQLKEKLGLSRENQVYLKQIESKLNLPMPAIAKLITHLSDKGYVYWRHDENGADGTYIYLSETGYEAVDSQNKALLEYSTVIADKFGHEKTKQILVLLKELDDVLHEDSGIIEMI